MNKRYRALTFHVYWYLLPWLLGQPAVIYRRGHRGRNGGGADVSDDDQRLLQGVIHPQHLIPPLGLLRWLLHQAALVSGRVQVRQQLRVDEVLSLRIRQRRTRTMLLRWKSFQLHTLQRHPSYPSWMIISSPEIFDVLFEEMKKQTITEVAESHFEHSALRQLHRCSWTDFAIRFASRTFSLNSCSCLVQHLNFLDG